MSYAVQVMVIDRKSNRGVSGQRVKAYGGAETKTNSNGMATVVVNSSTATIYVNGMQAYNGSASSAPKPILYIKG